MSVRGFVFYLRPVICLQTASFLPFERLTPARHGRNRVYPFNGLGASTKAMSQLAAVQPNQPVP